MSVGLATAAARPEARSWPQCPSSEAQLPLPQSAVTATDCELPVPRCRLPKFRGPDAAGV